LMPSINSFLPSFVSVFSPSLTPSLPSFLHFFCFIKLRLKATSDFWPGFLCFLVIFICSLPWMQNFSFPWGFLFHGWFNMMTCFLASDNSPFSARSLWAVCWAWFLSCLPCMGCITSEIMSEVLSRWHFSSHMVFWFPIPSLLFGCIIQLLGTAISAWTLPVSSYCDPDNAPAWTVLEETQNEHPGYSHFLLSSPFHVLKGFKSCKDSRPRLVMGGEKLHIT
jgi:hypothetical protein